MKCSFPPVVDSHSRLLILGSLPGEESLRQQQYYAHPRNGFWPMLAAVFDEPISLVYEARLAFILRHNLALWDTVQCAERQGSLDQHIQNPEANDFPRLFAEYPAICQVAFNGSTSANLFQRLVIPQLAPDTLARLRLLPMPSTSPANARPLAEKVARWRAIRD